MGPLREGVDRGRAPLKGFWFNRSQEYAAKKRGQAFGKYEFAEEETVVFDPLPCWSHLPVDEQRRRVATLVHEIEEEARIRRQETGVKPLGVKEILAQEPTRRPKKLKKSPAPFVHAATKAMRRELWEAYAWFVAAYRDAAEKLRAGDRDPPFPPASPSTEGRIVLLDLGAQKHKDVTMRTTIDLPDELLRKVKAKAALDGRTLKDLITLYVEQGLRGVPLHTPPPQRQRSELPVARRATGRPVPSLTNADIQRIWDEEESGGGRRH